MKTRSCFLPSLLVLTILCTAPVVLAQSSSFTYQGRLTDGGTAASGNYDLQFALWDSASGGSQVNSTLTLNSVAVSNGVFVVTLDFGANSFPGASRFLEISARAIGAGSFTLLTPRQQVTSTPYAVRSASSANADTATNATNATTAANATQLGGIAASQYVQTGDSRLSDPRTPTAGSGNYIQNSTTQQVSTNFSISGNGIVGGTLFGNTVTGNTVNAGIQFNIGGSRVLRASGTQSSDSLFVGTGTGPNQTVFGGNTFVGQNAGNSNVNGLQNAFLGNDSGKLNSSGANNVFLGFSAAPNNTTGSSNTIIGSLASLNNSSGSNNVFLGFSAATNNTSGNSNTIIGSQASLAAINLTNATAIGAFASVAQSNSLVLGSNSPATNVGIGTTAPQARLHVAGDVRVDGNITLFSLGTASSTQATLCRNTSSEIAFCNSSSLRYKKNITPFIGGLDIINRLRPINFTWKQDGTKDIGFGAEEVEKVAPLFTFRNNKGEIEGVRYDRLGVVFVNAIKEQQAQIERQREQLQDQQDQLDALKILVCRSHRRASACR